MAAGSALEGLGVVDDGSSEPNVERLAARGVAFAGGRGVAGARASVKYVLGVGRSVPEGVTAKGIPARWS